MILDNKDFPILDILNKNKKIKYSVYALAKHLYPTIKDTRGALVNKSKPISQRVRKLLRYGYLLNEINEGKHYYTINRDKAVFMEKATLRGGKLTFYFKGIFMLKNGNNFWDMLQFV